MWGNESILSWLKLCHVSLFGIYEMCVWGRRKGSAHEIVWMGFWGIQKGMVKRVFWQFSYNPFLLWLFLSFSCFLFNKESVIVCLAHSTCFLYRNLFIAKMCCRNVPRVSKYAYTSIDLCGCSSTFGKNVRSMQTSNVSISGMKYKI